MNRVADVALAGLGLVVTSPFLAVAALAVKLEDGGPILFRQTRVGKDGVDFELLKLRSMVVDAESKGAGYAVDRGDSRITRVTSSSAMPKVASRCGSTVTWYSRTKPPTLATSDTPPAFVSW